MADQVYQSENIRTGIPLKDQDTHTIVVKARKTVAVYDAVGGPEKPYIARDGFKAEPTDSGEYIIAGCWPHSSNRYSTWSKIKWGTPLKVEKSQVMVFYDKRWQLLSSLTSVSEQDISSYYQEYWGRYEIPSAWKFNDFGHMTCFIFKDKNRNGKFDKDFEQIHGEMFHTVPANEAETELGKKVILQESHGCIHVKPKDIDVMIKKGYMSKGNVVYIYPYTIDAPCKEMPALSNPPYSLHFYPKNQKLIVMGGTK